MKQALVVWNKKSGLSQNADLIETHLAALCQYYTISRAEVEQIIDADSAKSKFHLEECELIIAIGGDGTVSAAANIAVLFETKFLVIPTGTFNHFAVHLNIPRDIDGAFKLLESGTTKQIDVGKVNDRVFINFISLGYYTDIIRTRTAAQKAGSSKWGGFIGALVKETLRRKRHELAFASKDRTIQKKTPLLFIGNGVFEFGSSDILSNRKSFTDNKIHLAVLKDYSRVRLFVIAVFSTMFDTTRWIAVENYLLSSCVITDTSSAKVELALDGEVLTMQSTLHVSSLSRALSIVLPVETTA